MAKTTTLKDLKIEIELLHQIVKIISNSENLNTLLHETARVLADTIKADSCFIYLLDHNSYDLILSGAWPPHPYQVGKLKIESGEGLTGWVAEHKKLLVLSKNAYKDSRFKLFQNLPEDKFEAFLSIPIILNNELIGVINIQNRRTKNFSLSQIKLLTNISDQVAGAIERKRLLKIAEKKSKQIETITHLSKSLVSGSYLQEILQLIVTMTAQMMDSKICSLMLLDEEKQELKIASTQSLSEAYRKKPPVKVIQSASGKALKLKKPVAILDVTKESEYNYPEIARQEGLCSMLSVPMFIKDKPIGVINCYTTNVHIFTEEEINIMQTIANQSAIAIENTRLFEESKTAKEALETRKVIERAKGMLMRQRQMNEEEAFQFIQKQAMNLRRTMREIAEAVLLTDGLKNK